MNKKCQVFTPENYVKELLDSVGYSRNLYGNTILENSCGDGNILLSIVQRYIEDCRNNNMSNNEIIYGLQADIYAIEIDKKQYEKCKDNLNKLVKKYGINEVKWNLYNDDYLRWNEPVEFDYIIGNPPYITYKELTTEEQVFLKNTFETCKKGKFDYCYAFIEKSINSLSDTGKMSYLIPSSIFKTVFGLNLRNNMKPYISIIKDYTQEKVFDNALVKSSIMVLNKHRENEILMYEDITSGRRLQIDINQLEDKWFFVENNIEGLHRFGDYYKVSHSVATLLNEAFVISEYEEVEDGVICNNILIENDMLKNAASPRSLHYNRDEKIIFPYIYGQRGLVRFTEEELIELYPGVYEYLNQFRESLNNRKSDNNARWFEYGRSQAIAKLNTNKLLISTIVTDNVIVYELDAECIPYAGMYIVQQENVGDEYTLEQAVNILNSAEFMQYVLDVGIHISGSSIRITSKDIEDYRF